jgi:hypothetical protein
MPLWLFGWTIAANDAMGYSRHCRSGQKSIFVRSYSNSDQKWCTAPNDASANRVIRCDANSSELFHFVASTDHRWQFDAAN